MRISYSKYLNGALKRMQWASDQRGVEREFHDFYHGWLSIVRYCGISEQAEREKLNVIFKFATGNTLDELTDIGQRYAHDNARARGTGTTDFPHECSEEEKKEYKRFQKMTGWDIDKM